VQPFLELANGMGHRAGNGFVVPRTPDALFHCVEQLVNDREASREMGEIGHSLVSTRFPADRLVADIVQLYSKLTMAERIPESASVEKHGTEAHQVREGS
jgi:glycosyltransferase involved in cell wall biosynthesis